MREGNRIITLAGGPGTGTSTAAKGLHRALGFEVISSGALFREIAERVGETSLVAFNKRAETETWIDDEVDSMLKALADRDGLIVDSRLAYVWLPGSLKVRLVCNSWTAARRVYAAKRAGEEAGSLAETHRLIVERGAIERRRYRERYGADIETDTFDLVVNTDECDQDEVVRRILARYEVWLAA